MIANVFCRYDVHLLHRYIDICVDTATCPRCRSMNSQAELMH